MKKKIRRLCINLGFTGRVVFRPTKEFGKPIPIASFHQVVADLYYDVGNACEVAERDLFDTIVFYIAPQSYYKYFDKLQSNETWTKGEINGLRKAVGPCSKLPNTCIDELQSLSYGHSKEFKITKEQTKFGLDYLKDTVFTSKGTTRNAKRNFLKEEPNAVNILKNFAKFRFIGLASVSQPLYWQNKVGEYTLPIYRTYDKNGNYFDYTAGMWGNCGVVNIHYSK